MRLVSIKFRHAGKRYDFNAQGLELKSGEQVVVETDRGRALGIVILPPREVSDSEIPDKLKNVLRLANDEDRKMASVNASREKEAIQFCQQRIEARSMLMKLVLAEYLFDGSKIIFYFTADGRVDFRDLVRDLAHHFHTRIEMRQIGVRDEAKMVGGLGICGRELCCCSFLTQFNPVSVKMAKEQGLALNPNKISGQCGRLLCCLSYEYESYCKLKKGLPRYGKKSELGGRTVEVIDINILGQAVTLRLDDGEKVTISAEQYRKGELPTEQQANPQVASTRETPPPKRQREQEGKSGQRQKQKQKQKQGQKQKPGQKQGQKAGPKPEARSSRGGQSQRGKRGSQQGRKPSPNSATEETAKASVKPVSPVHPTPPIKSTPDEGTEPRRPRRRRRNRRRPTKQQE